MFSGISKSLPVSFVVALLLSVSRLLAQAPAIEVYFSPEHDCEAEIVRAIAHARKTIRIQAYSFTSGTIANALVNASKRPGVDVQVILDRTWTKAEKKSSKLNDLLNAQIHTFLDAHYKAHNKVIVIDGEVVITGSYNFSQDAKKNLENLLVVRDPIIAKTYSDNWDKCRGSPNVTPAKTPGPSQHRESYTPGKVRPGWTLEMTEAKGGTQQYRHVPVTLRREVWHDYGYDTTVGPYDAHHKDYEFDHLIPNCLGGARVKENIWPQPVAGPWNAHDKDKLEGYVRSQVLQHKITLAQAQAMFTPNWIETYKAQFGPKPDARIAAGGVPVRFRQGRAADTFYLPDVEIEEDDQETRPAPSASISGRVPTGNDPPAPRFHEFGAIQAKRNDRGSASRRVATAHFRRVTPIRHGRAVSAVRRIESEPA